MAYGTVNVDTVTTSTPGGVLGAGNASIMKNRIINGAMVIDQRNAGASVSTSSGGNVYTLDRWNVQYSQPSKFTVQQNAGSVTPPVGFVNYLGCTSTSAYSVASAELFDIRQYIEGYNVADLNWGTANAKSITLSFWVRSSLTGTFGGYIANSGFSRAYVFSYTISAANTWEQKTVTITGDTTGTWLTTNGIGLVLSLTLSAGSAYQGSAGSWQAGTAFAVTGQQSVVGTSGATFYITGVQLEVGSSATGFEYRIYGTELANCQRYYQQAYPISYMGYASQSVYDSVISMPLFQPMRTAPTSTRVSASYRNYSATTGPNTGLPDPYASHINFLMQSTGGAGMVGFYNGSFTFDAEL